MSTHDFRIQHDSMGESGSWPRPSGRRRPSGRSNTFPISGTPIEPGVVHALGEVKAAAARANADLGVLPAELPRRSSAARAVADGRHDAEFPIDVFRFTGSGTSSNMNANEVIATLAGGAGVAVHPNYDVNASQSSTHTFPTAIHVAATLAWFVSLLPALDVMATSLEAKAGEFDLVKSGHAPDGRHPGDPGRGVRRVRRHRPLRSRAAGGRASACASCPWAAPPWAWALHAPGLRHGRYIP